MMFKTMGFNKSIVVIDTDDSIITFSQASRILKLLINFVNYVEKNKIKCRDDVC
jgi:archaellum biogenesis ATPase FlaH